MLRESPPWTVSQKVYYVNFDILIINKLRHFIVNGILFLGVADIYPISMRYLLDIVLISSL